MLCTWIPSPLPPYIRWIPPTTGYGLVPELVLHISGHISNFYRLSTKPVAEINLALGQQMTANPTLGSLWLGTVPGELTDNYVKLVASSSTALREWAPSVDSAGAVSVALLRVGSKCSQCSTARE
jgi:hypothetical protein